MSNGKNFDAEWNDSFKEDLAKLKEKNRDKEVRKLSPSSHQMDVEKKDSKREKVRESSRHESKSKKDDDKRDRRDSRERHRRHRHDDKKERRKHRSSSRSSSGSRRHDRRRSSRDRKRDDEKHRHHSRHSRSRSRSRDYQRERRDIRDTDDKKAMDIIKKIDIPKDIISDRKLVAQYQAEELKKKAEEMSGVKIPSFYNTSAVNPLTLAEQQRKRKLLWSKSKDNENTSTKMIGKAIIEGQDEKTAEKFRKLMGIKSVDELKDVNTVDKIQTMQKQAFDHMDKEYEYARMTTHLNRGKGLGFASHTASLLLDANQRLQFQ